MNNWYEQFANPTEKDLSTINDILETIEETTLKLLKDSLDQDKDKLAFFDKDNLDKLKLYLVIRQKINLNINQGMDSVIHLDYVPILEAYKEIGEKDMCELVNFIVEIRKILENKYTRMTIPANTKGKYNCIKELVFDFESLKLASLISNPQLIDQKIYTFFEDFLTTRNITNMLKFINDSFKQDIQFQIKTFTEMLNDKTRLNNNKLEILYKYTLKEILTMVRTQESLSYLTKVNRNCTTISECIDNAFDAFKREKYLRYKKGAYKTDDVVLFPIHKRTDYCNLCKIIKECSDIQKDLFQLKILFKAPDQNNGVILGKKYAFKQFDCNKLVFSHTKLKKKDIISFYYDLGSNNYAFFDEQKVIRIQENEIKVHSVSQGSLVFNFDSLYGVMKESN